MNACLCRPSEVLVPLRLPEGVCRGSHRLTSVSRLSESGTFCFASRSGPQAETINACCANETTPPRPARAFEQYYNNLKRSRKTALLVDTATRRCFQNPHITSHEAAAITTAVLPMSLAMLDSSYA